jgi:hypothetical protein
MVKPFQSVSEKESYAAVYVVLGHRENENSEKYFCSFVGDKQSFDSKELERTRH